MFTFVLQIIFKLNPDEKNDLSTSGLTPDFYLREANDANGTSADVSLSRFVLDVLSFWTLLFESGEKATSTTIAFGLHDKSYENSGL